MVKKFKTHKKSKVEKKKKDYTIKNLYTPEFTSSAFIHRTMKETLAKKNMNENLSNKLNLLENIYNGTVQNSTKGKMASKIK